MTSKDTALRCRKCDMAIPDGGQMLCMGVKPISLIDDVTDNDCPKHRITPEAPEIKKRPGRKPKAAKKAETRTASDGSGMVQSETAMPLTKLPAAEMSEALGLVCPPEQSVERSDLDSQRSVLAPKTADADPVHHPSHYAWRGGLECIEIARELCRGSDGIAAYLIGCATKYIYRYPRKNGLQDLDKAIECLTMLRDIEAKKGGDADAR